MCCKKKVECCCPRREMHKLDKFCYGFENKWHDHRKFVCGCHKGHYDYCSSKKCRPKCHCHKDKRHDHKKKKKDKADLNDFEFYTLKPNVEQNNRKMLQPYQQTEVASVTIEKLRKGDLVWLNGVVGLDNDRILSERTVIMRVFKGTPPVFTPGEEIYRAKFEIDNELDDDNVVEPLAHVDVVKQADKNVTYTVTLQPFEEGVFLSGPVTFTAAVIDKG